MSAERLQKILARAGIDSRRGAEELIRRGEVVVNGRVAGLGDRADQEHDSIKVKGKRLPASLEKKYFLHTANQRHYVFIKNWSSSLASLSDKLSNILRPCIYIFAVIFYLFC